MLWVWLVPVFCPMDVPREIPVLMPMVCPWVTPWETVWVWEMLSENDCPYAFPKDCP